MSHTQKEHGPRKAKHPEPIVIPELDLPDADDMVTVHAAAESPPFEEDGERYDGTSMVNRAREGAEGFEGKDVSPYEDDHDGHRTWGAARGDTMGQNRRHTDRHES